MSRGEIKRKLQKLGRERAELQAQLDESMGRTLIACESNCYGKGCGKRTQIRKLTYIQTYWYVQPYSCTGGDYWKMDEGQFDCIKCGHRNRLYNRKQFQDLKRYFADSVDAHDDVGRPPKIDERPRR